MTGGSASVRENRYGLLRIYSYYRCALALLLLLVYFAFSRDAGAQPFLPFLYLGTAIPIPTSRFTSRKYSASCKIL